MSRIIWFFICIYLISCSKDNKSNQLRYEFIQCEFNVCKIFASNRNDILIDEKKEPIMRIEFYSGEKIHIKNIMISVENQYSGIAMDSLGRIEVLSSKGKKGYSIIMYFDSLGNYKDKRDSLKCCYPL